MISFIHQHKDRLKRHTNGLARFGAIGVFNVLTEFTVFTILLKLDVIPLAANALGFLAANIQSYLANANLTFRENGRAAKLSLPGYGRFFAAHSLTLVISTGFIAFLGPALGRHFGHDLGMIAAKAPAVAFGFIANYAMSSLFVFRKDRRLGVDVASAQGDTRS